MKKKIFIRIATFVRRVRWVQFGYWAYKFCDGLIVSAASKYSNRNIIEFHTES